MSLVLMTREELENCSLAHYRTPGSKNGERLYQYKDGSLTPLGRIHYGVGLGRDRSGASVFAGKKLVDQDGNLTKKGIQKVEDSGRDGYMHISDSDKKSGKAKNRLEIISQMNKEASENDPEGKMGNNVHSVGKEVFDKYKDKYAEATLKDLGLPVNEKNKDIVDKFFSKYDTYYDWDAGNLSSEEATKREKEFGERIEKRFGKKLSDKTDKEIKTDVEDKVKDFNKTTKEKMEERVAETKERNAKLKEEIKEIRSLADDELDKRITRLQKEKQLAELINERNNREQSELHRRASKIFKDVAENLARRALGAATDELLNKYKNRMSGSNAVKEKDKFNEGNKDNGQNKSDNDKKPDNKPDNGGSNRFSKEEKSRIRSMAESGKSVAEIAKALGADESKVKGFMSSAGITIS